MMKILVVDDSKTIRRLVAECLKEMGHCVAYAANGVESLQFVTDNDVDLILMDVEMPQMSGFEATKAIRALKKHEWFPIIFLTMHDDDRSFENGILAGGDAYLPKPLNPVRLRNTVIAMERIYHMRKKLKQAQLELQIANQDLERLSLSDQWTGLGNRRHFDSNLTMQFALSRRNKSPLSLLMCDIDFFKTYNDTLGHQQGDVCLAEVAKIIKEKLERTSDLICRYGGEEFVAILPNTPLQEARALAEKIRDSVIQKNILYGEKQQQMITLSVGVATYVGQYQNAADLVRAADTALYLAKQNGRNRVEIN